MIERPVVIVAQPHLVMLLPLLDADYEALPLWEPAGEARLAEAQVLVGAGEFPVPPALVDRMPRLGLIAMFTSGYDGIDVGWAKARGIAVSHAQDVNHEDVADHAIGLILAQRRRILDGDRQVHASGWSAGAKMLTRSLGGARLGIVGLGGIGAAIARRAEPMRMEIAWWGPRAKPDASWRYERDLYALAAWSDILVVAARASDDNRGLISAEILDALGPDGLLVNVARGQLVDEEALIAALRGGRLGGAALDVFAVEPTPAARWAALPNLVLTPHTAGATDQAVARMKAQLLANLAAFFAHEPLPNPAA